jgi:predicted helicase
VDGALLDNFRLTHGFWEAKDKPAAAVKSEPAAAGDSRAPTPKDASLFHAIVAAGKKLAELHVGYEQQPEFPLRRRENPQSPLNWRLEKMRLSKDKSSLTYNDFLTLDGIPPETFEYRLGNRSALEWVIDQYQVSTDKRSGITSDPNRPDDPEYIVRLLGQVITVSLETVKVVKALPALDNWSLHDKTTAGKNHERQGRAGSP